MSSFSSVVILNKSVDLGYILLAFFWVVFFMDSCLHIRIRWTRAPKEDIFCLTASEIFLDLPVCTKNHDYDIGIVVMNRSKKCTSHQLLTEKLLDLTAWQWYKAFVKVRGDSIPGLFLFMELWWDCWIGGSFLPNTAFWKKFSQPGKKRPFSSQCIMKGYMVEGMEPIIQQPLAASCRRFSYEQRYPLVGKHPLKNKGWRSMNVPPLTLVLWPEWKG